MYQNFKAKSTIEKIQSILFSYLEADPKKTQYISTIIPSKRNANNGFANVEVTYIDYTNTICKKMIRVENNLFGDSLFIKPHRASGLKNADLIIFYDTKLDNLYISDKVICNMSWLDNKSIRDIDINNYGKTYFKYKIDTLLEQHAIFQIVTDNKIHLIHDSFLHYYNREVLIGHEDTKTLKDYNPKKPDNFYVLCDSKDRDTVFWCYHNETQADKSATIMGLVEEFSKYTDITKKAIYNKLYRALKKESFTKIPIRKDLSAMELSKLSKFLDGDKIIIGLSKVQDTFINVKVNKTASSNYKAEYMKKYRTTKK